MECSICLNLIENSCVGSCMHHFCYICLLKWCVQGSSCPICKKYIYEIKFDKEFDSINNPTISLPIISLTKQIIVDFSGSASNIVPGITLVNYKGIGVKISNLKKNGQCFIKGLRKEDIILYINNVPSLRHKDSIEIINNAFLTKTSLCFYILL